MSAENPKDYRYLESHEWHRKEADGTIAIGITQHAADELCRYILGADDDFTRRLPAKR